MKTLILVYVHGFKGDQTTFRDYPKHLEQRLRQIYPQLNVLSKVYPPYETRGELSVAVTTFLSFVETEVIDAEISNGTASPVMSPSVGVILLAHSMGGLVIVDATLQILARDRSIVFPRIIGLICFDSPFLGLHSSVFAQDVLQRGTAKFKELKAVSAAVPIGSYLFAKVSSKQPASKDGEKKGESPNWGKIAGLAAAGVAATAAAAAGTVWYLKSQNVDLNWAKEHMVFVGAIFRKPEELKGRLWTMFQCRDRVQMINYYSVIQPAEVAGKPAANGASADPTAIVKGLGKLVSGEGNGVRTFCNVPKESPYSSLFTPNVNKKATGEIEAHVTMFESDKNPEYTVLVSENVERISGWIANLKDV